MSSKLCVDCSCTLETVQCWNPSGGQEDLTQPEAQGGKWRSGFTLPVTNQRHNPGESFWLQEKATEPQSQQSQQETWEEWEDKKLT